jgi:hypothetical protein
MIEKNMMYRIWILNLFDAVLTKSLIAKYPGNVSEFNGLMKNVVLSDEITFLVKFIICGLLMLIIWNLGNKMKDNNRMIVKTLMWCVDKTYQILVLIEMLVFYFGGEIFG